jgi:N-acyl-D-aspartate/D-glutamate deacylase
MNRRYAAIIGLVAVVPFWGCATPSYDLIVAGGMVHDGTGNSEYAADVGIDDGVIAAVGDLSGESARRTIAAAGMAVTPGFIDMMGGSSLPLLLDPVSAQSKLRQGITTAMMGEGGSPAPQDDRTMQEIQERLSVDTSWTTYAEYLPLLDDKGVGLNLVHNVGAAQVRRLVLGDVDQEPDAEELARMKELVTQAMEQGAVGLSSALIYPPGSYATTEELIELAKAAAARGGVYFTHLRNESGRVIEALEEAIRIGREAEIPVHVYHLKAAGQENWHLMTDALSLIEDARSGGLAITADVYPYIRNGIGLGSFLHPRHYARGEQAFLETLASADVRRQLRREVENTSDWENWYRHVGFDWDNVLIARVGPDTDSTFVGLSIQQVADLRGVDAWQAFFDLVQAGRVSVNPLSMNEEQKHQAMQAPFVCFDTDASPTNPDSVASAHPRAFGSFTRVLAKYVREEGVIGLNEAIRKLTSLPATILGLEDRGRIAVGMRADLLVFDPNTVQDRATFTDPLQYSQGIDYVVVNGALVIDGGSDTGALPGEVIRHRQ